MREERRLKVFENRGLGRIFRPKMEKVVRGCRRLHNAEFNDLYSSPNIIRLIKSRSMRWAGHVVRMGERRGVCRVRPLRRPRLRWEDNIKMDLQEVGRSGHGLD